MKQLVLALIYIMCCNLHVTKKNQSPRLGGSKTKTLIPESRDQDSSLENHKSATDSMDAHGQGDGACPPLEKILRAPITDPRMTCVTSEYYLLSACLYDNVAQIHTREN